MKFLAPAILLSLPCVAQATWTVNSAGGAQFPAIQPAILAAAPGDRIEVQGAGPYAGFVVDRGVEVESVIGAISGSIEIVALPAGQRARVSGFVVDQAANGWVSVRDCNGRVLLANIAYTGGGVPVPVATRPGLQVSLSANVIVDHCNFRGHDDAAYGAPGIAVVASGVAFLGGSALGGLALSGSPVLGDSGRAGLEVSGGHVTMRGITLRGGPGGSGTVTGGNGGPALLVTSATALVLGQSQLRGGSGGLSPVPGTQGYAAVGNVRFTPDTLLIGPTVGATAILTRPVVTSPGGVLVGTTLQWSLSGLPNQPVWLGLDLAFGYLPLPQFDSALVLTPGAALQPVMFLDAQGSGTLSLAIPNGAAFRHLDVVAQAASFVFGGLILTAPAVTHTL